MSCRGPVAPRQRVLLQPLDGGIIQLPRHWRCTGLWDRHAPAGGCYPDVSTNGGVRRGHRPTPRGPRPSVLSPTHGPAALCIYSPRLDVSHQLNLTACGLPRAASFTVSRFAHPAARDGSRFTWLNRVPFLAILSFIYPYTDSGHLDRVQFGASMENAACFGVEPWVDGCFRFLGRVPAGKLSRRMVTLYLNC